MCLRVPESTLAVCLRVPERTLAVCLRVPESALAACLRVPETACGGREKSVPLRCCVCLREKISLAGQHEEAEKAARRVRAVVEQP